MTIVAKPNPDALKMPQAVTTHDQLQTRIAELQEQNSSLLAQRDSEVARLKSIIAKQGTDMSMGADALIQMREEGNKHELAARDAVNRASTLQANNDLLLRVIDRLI